ncbi:MAG: Rpp14/Pop5 family protein [Candidatus Micrarchaeota archaeon]|nr:Rpp14/Pop5 family protein [Candidatus Micrarchaeota archaeon]
MREKQRYLLVEASSAIGTTDPKEFGRSLYPELRKAIGELVYHRVNPKVIRVMPGSRFVIKSALQGNPDLVLALALTKSLAGQRIGFYTLKSSGTIKALLKFEH